MFAKQWEREGGGEGGEHVGVDAGSPGDNDEQTEETLMADNANVEEEESLEKFINNCQSKRIITETIHNHSFGPKKLKTKTRQKQNSEI